MTVVILHHVGGLKAQIGVFNYPKIQDGVLPWETTNEVSELQQDNELLSFTTKNLAGYSKTNYSIKKVEEFRWEGTFKNKTGGKEMEGNCTCFVFE